MVVVLVALFLAAVQRIFVHVLLMRIERLTLARPRRVRHPTVVEHLPAQRVAPTARQVDLTLRQLAIRRATHLLRIKINPLALQRRHILQHRVLILEPAVLAHVVADQALERGKELRLPTKEQRRAVDECAHVNHILRVQIQQFEEVKVGRTVIHVLLDAVEKRNLVDRGHMRHLHNTAANHMRRRIRLHPVHRAHVAVRRHVVRRRVHPVAHDLARRRRRYRQVRCRHRAIALAAALARRRLAHRHRLRHRRHFVRHALLACKRASATRHRLVRRHTPGRRSLTWAYPIRNVPQHAEQPATTRRTARVG